VGFAHIELAGQTVSGQVLLSAAGLVVVLVAGLTLARSVRRRRAAAALQAASMSRHDEAVRSYKASALEWQRRREELRTLLDAAQSGGTAQAPAGLALQRGERVYLTTTATLEGQGNAAEVHGTLTITSRRIVLDEQVWDLDTIAQLRHDGPDRTLLLLCQQQGWIGLSYADEPVTRMYLELVVSTSGTSRSELLRNVAQGLNDHELRRPRTPLPAEPVEGLGRRAHAEATAWHAARVAETEKLTALVDARVLMVPTQGGASKRSVGKSRPLVS